MMGHGEVGSAAPAPLTVERGLVLAPEVLQRLLPDVAVVVKDAMQSAGRDIQTEQPPPSNQLLSSDKQDKQPSASKQPPQHKPKQEKATQPNLESCQRWNMFPCNLCTLRFPSRPTLNEHRLSHKAFKSLGIRRRERRQKAKQQYTCKFCPQVFPIKELWQLHMNIHVLNKSDRRKIQEKLYFCYQCEKYFSNLFELRAHKKHTVCFLKDMFVPKKYHLCHVCSEEFEDTFDLTLHLRTHGAPLKSYSVRKPKPYSIGAKPHTDTELSILALTPKLAESINSTKAQEDRELKESSSDPNPKTPGSVNATNVHKDRNLGDSFSAQNPKPISVNATETHKHTQLGASHSVCNPKGTSLVNPTKAHKYIELGECISSRNAMPTGLIIVNDPKSHNDLGGIDSAQKPKADSINATKTYKRAEDSFHTCNRVAKTYTRLKLPKLTDPAKCPTANNGTTITKKVTVKEISRDNLNKRINVEPAILQISNVSEVQSQEKAELTNVSCMADSNKNITPFRYNFQDNMFAINSVASKEAFGESDKGLDTEDSNGYEEHETKEGIVLKPELLEQLGIDLNEVSAVNNNVEYVLPDTGNPTYDTGIHSEVDKRNTTVIKEKEPDVVFGIGEYGSDVSNAIVKEEPQELDDKERMLKAVEYHSEIMIKTELLSLCKDEVEDKSVLGLLLHESQDVPFQVSHKDTAAENETVIAKESAEFTKNVSIESKDLVNAALEAAWRELYAEHEAMELALVKIEKDPEIIDTMDLTDTVNKQDTVKVEEEVEVLEDAITDVVDLTINENKKDTLLKEESEVLGDVSDDDDQFNDIIDDCKDPQGIKLDKVDLEVEQAGLYVDLDGYISWDAPDLDGMEAVCVKQECDSDGCGDNEAALAALYEDHVVKQELVLGPELLQKPRVVYTPPGQIRLPAAKKNKSAKTRKPKAPVEEKKAKTSEKIAKRNSAEIIQKSSDIQEATPEKPAGSSSSSELNTLTAETVFKCDKCGFNIKSDLKKHINTHMLMEAGTSRKASKFTCKTCNCIFDTKLLLQEHEKSRHSVKYFACDECEYATTHARNLQNHLRTHTGEKPFKCRQCSSAFTQRSHLRRHLRTHTGEKPFKCRQCSSAFTQRSHLRRHLRTHTGEKSFKCSQCSSAFTQSCHLQRHLRTHTGEKSFKCSQCSSAFTQSSHLQYHLRFLRTHTGEKSFKCSQCSSAFSRSSDLRIHYRIHTGEKPFKCSQCSSAFTQSYHLQYHLRTHSGEKPFECNICDYKTTRSDTLKRHLMSRHSGQKPFGCDACSYRGATKGYLREHMKTHHKPA